MRQSIKDFAAIAASTLPIRGPIYEFGSMQVPGQEGFADLRPLFPAKEYVGADMRMGPGVDKLLNLHQLDLPSDYVGTVLCFDTLEHVEYPHRALEEIHRVLKPDGLVLISSVMNFPIHEYPFDYWRFTPEAFKSLLKPFVAVFVGFAGSDDFPHTVVGIGFKGCAPQLVGFKKEFDKWRELQIPVKKRVQRADKNDSAKRIAKLWIPPVLVPTATAVYRSFVRLISFFGRMGRG
jgi:SAM-dependent methyltransferase